MHCVWHVYRRDLLKIVFRKCILLLVTELRHYTTYHIWLIETMLLLFNCEYALFIVVIM